MTLLALVLVLGAAVPLTPAQAAGPRGDAELERCRALRARIDHYTRLRRGGGNSAQMERWRRARRKYESEYREKRCYRFGSRLKLDR